MATQVIVIGGGLAGLSAAHTVLEQGGRVLLLECNPFCGGNSTKATSGICGTPTITQIQKKIDDNVLLFEKDVAKSANLGDETKPIHPCGKVLVWESGPSVNWLMQRFGLDLSLVSLMGGHSAPRCHRGKERFPGMTITYGLMEEYERIVKESGEKLARLYTKSRATTLLTDKDGKVIGVEYEKGGQKFQEYGPVIIATGGYGADFSASGLLMKYRPDLASMPTTNGEHCRGDGIKMSEAIGADLIDMEFVQVHPTGLVDLKKPDAKVKFLAAEALRGSGGILLDANGKRFCDELGRRDYVTGEMNRNKGPFRLVLNGKSSQAIEWHCKHYVGRNIMKKFESGADLAKEMGIPLSQLEQTFNAYNENAKQGKDQWGKRFFNNVPYFVKDYFYVSIVTPVVHYCMGGLKISPDGEVLSKGKPIPGLFAAGEVAGGVHGKNRLGGNSLLDCVVYGRVSGRAATKYLLGQGIQALQTVQSGGKLETPQSAVNRLSAISGQLSGSGAQTQNTGGLKTFTAQQVAQHNKESDCWVILHGNVYDVTKFLDDHPGGKEAIMIYAGQDATEQFDMLHQKSVLDKFGPQFQVGKLQ